jgi:hypothetical protein
VEGLEKSLMTSRSTFPVRKRQLFWKFRDWSSEKERYHWLQWCRKNPSLCFLLTLFLLCKKNHG